ncbi:hypothetical protein GCM10007386_00530 [Pseudoduganella dura]|nr:hypothetical protein GCM10007386_00530 [Pseudoduganella dura]
MRWACSAVTSAIVTMVVTVVASATFALIPSGRTVSPFAAMLSGNYAPPGRQRTVREDTLHESFPTVFLAGRIKYTVAHP